MGCTLDVRGPYMGWTWLYMAGPGCTWLYMGVHGRYMAPPGQPDPSRCHDIPPSPPRYHASALEPTMRPPRQNTPILHQRYAERPPIIHDQSTYNLPMGKVAMTMGRITMLDAMQPISIAPTFRPTCTPHSTRPYPNLGTCVIAMRHGRISNSMSTSTRSRRQRSLSHIVNTHVQLTKHEHMPSTSPIHALYMPHRHALYMPSTIRHNSLNILRNLSPASLQSLSDHSPTSDFPLTHLLQDALYEERWGSALHMWSTVARQLPYPDLTPSSEHARYHFEVDRSKPPPCNTAQLERTNQHADMSLLFSGCFFCFCACSVFFFSFFAFFFLNLETTGGKTHLQAHRENKTRHMHRETRKRPKPRDTIKFETLNVT